MDDIKNVIRRTEQYFAKYGMKLTTKQLEERLISKKVYKVKSYKVDKVQRNKILKEKLLIAKRIAKKISKLSDVLLVAVTGSVAAGKPDKNDDIDFLIITKKNRLWLTRLRLYWQLRKEKVRRKGDEEETDQLCFNIWLDEIGLRLPESKQNLRNGLDAIMMKVLIDKKNMYKKFLAKNRWIKNYVATGYDKKSN